MKDGHTYKNDKFLLIILAVLCVLIIGLTIELIVAMHLRRSDVGFADNIQMGAAEISQEIELEVSKNGEIDMNRADELYKSAIDNYKGDERLAIVMKYASFVYNNELDAYRALNIMKWYENDVTEGMTSGLYYELMASFCKVVGDLEKEEYYRNLSIKVWPESPSKYSEKKGDDL